MLTYSQSTGTTRSADLQLLGTGYSGNGPYINSADAQNLPGHGPCPQGKYTLVPIDPPDHLGPLAFRLNPDAENEMYGRSGMCIHGDNVEMNHTASDGCIILGHPARQAIMDGGDFVLMVIA
jgi:hypothetical protein